MSLYNKYRPKSLADMKGDFSFIKRIFAREGHSHTYIFTGRRGSGKTTAARICAEEILKADELEIYEYNFADNKGIDTSREIIERCQYEPFGTCRVFIIDEFHQATTAAAEALLKILEEPPSFVYFFICTSKPEKIDPAAMSRGVKVNFPDLPEDVLSELVMDIARNEGETLSEKHALQIAEAGNGSAREALVILEQVLSLQEDKRTAKIRAMALVGTDATMQELAVAYYQKRSWKLVSGILDSMRKNGVNPESIRHYLLGYGANSLLSNDLILPMMEGLTPPTWDTGFNGLIYVLCKGCKSQ